MAGDPSLLPSGQPCIPRQLPSVDARVSRGARIERHGEARVAPPGDAGQSHADAAAPRCAGSEADVDFERRAEGAVRADESAAKETEKLRDEETEGADTCPRT